MMKVLCGGKGHSGWFWMKIPVAKDVILLQVGGKGDPKCLTNHKGNSH